jgi:hypothetical protein
MGEPILLKENLPEASKGDTRDKIGAPEGNQNASENKVVTVTTLKTEETRSENSFIIETNNSLILFQCFGRYPPSIGKIHRLAFKIPCSMFE